MRKADYLTLARVIRESLEANPDARHAIESLAREFATAASVDRRAFLQACGII